MGSNFHFVIYPVNQNNEFNFISIIKGKIYLKHQLSDKKMFENDDFLQSFLGSNIKKFNFRFKK